MGNPNDEESTDGHLLRAGRIVSKIECAFGSDKKVSCDFYVDDRFLDRVSKLFDHRGTNM